MSIMIDQQFKEKIANKLRLLLDLPQPKGLFDIKKFDIGDFTRDEIMYLQKLVTKDTNNDQEHSSS